MKKFWLWLAGVGLLLVIAGVAAVIALHLAPQSEIASNPATSSPQISPALLETLLATNGPKQKEDLTPAGILKVTLVKPGKLPAPSEANEPVWNQAKSLKVELGAASQGATLDLQALSDGQDIVFLAHWKEAGPPPAEAASAITNKFTIFWRLDPQWLVAHPNTCHTSCHTMYSAPAQPTRLERFSLSAIGVSSSGGLNGVGYWEAGQWTLHWSRPLTNRYLSDVQFNDLGKRYPFRIEVFPWKEGGIPQVSVRYAMEFDKP